MERSYLNERFELRYIRPEEGGQAADIEWACFPPNEACAREMMLARVETAPDLFLVAIDRETGRMAGTLNGLATDETSFRDEFFRDAGLHDPAGETVMLLGLAVLPDYRDQGLAKSLMEEYLRREQEKGRHLALLTCLDAKVEMYQHFGFRDHGLADSSWGGERWHEMGYTIS